jgi:hypothetical protein
VVIVLRGQVLLALLVEVLDGGVGNGPVHDGEELRRPCLAGVNLENLLQFRGGLFMLPLLHEGSDVGVQGVDDLPV